MADTIFFNLKLKRGRKPMEVFTKMAKSVKKRGATKSWKYEIDEERESFYIDFGDESSEDFVLHFDKQAASGFVKVYFPLEGELYEDEKKSEFKILLNMIYSARASFSSMEITDDYGIAEDYMKSKEYKLKLRELDDKERSRLDRLYRDGYTYHEELLLALIAEDLGLPEEFSWENVISPLIALRNSSLMQQIAETWLIETTSFKGERLCEMDRDRYEELGDVAFSVFAFVIGLNRVFFYKASENVLFNFRSFGQKDAQINKYFKDIFLPAFIEKDDYGKCESAYQYMLSILDYAGFIFCGKQGITPVERKPCKRINEKPADRSREVYERILVDGKAKEIRQKKVKSVSNAFYGVFAEVYERALEPYGFKKVKGKHPFFVRLVNNEIIHVVSIFREPQVDPEMVEYGIFGAVFTIYSYNFELDGTDKFWFSSNQEIYRDSDIYEERPDRYQGKYSLSYPSDNEKAMIESIEQSVEDTKNVMLAEFDKVTDIEAYVDYDKHCFPKGEIYECYKLYMDGGYREYRTRIRESSDRRTRYLIENNRIGTTLEQHEEDMNKSYERMEELVQSFEERISTPEKKREMIAELSAVKERNLERLKSYGLI